jgi:hypothetical protein
VEGKGMGGRKHLLSQGKDGDVRRVKVDLANLDRQMAEERAAGRKPYVVDDDEMIDLGRIQRRVRRD